MSKLDQLAALREEGRSSPGPQKHDVSLHRSPCSPIQLLMGIMGGSFPQVSNLFKVPFDIYSEAVKK